MNINSHILFSVLSISLCFCTQTSSATVFYSENFETGKDGGWSSEKGKTIILGKGPDSSSTALKISGCDTVGSPLCQLAESRSYILKIKSWSEKRGLYLIEIQEFDKQGKLISVPGMERIYEHIWKSGASRAKKQQTIEIPFDTSPDSGTVRVVIRKWGKESCWIDDVVIAENQTQSPPESDLCTSGSEAMMLKGPDGVLYPDWTAAGISKWKSTDRVFNIQDFGGFANDEKDDSDAFEKVCDAAQNAGGGTIQLNPGTLYLTRKILITADNIVIRGSGQDKTKIIFKLPDSQVFISVDSTGPQISPRNQVSVYYPGKNIHEVILTVDGKRIYAWNNSKQFQTILNGTFSKSSVSGKVLLEAVGAGRKLLRAEVVYIDGSKRATEQPFNFSEYGLASADVNSVFTFYGVRNCLRGKKFPLHNTIKRGENNMQLESREELNVGDYVCITAPATDDWNRKSLNTCTWGDYRQFVTRINKIAGNTIKLDQAVRIDFPLSDKCYAEKLQLIRYCAIEDLSIEQEGEIQKELKIGTILFRNALNCRAKNITVINTGFRPLYAAVAKNCHIADCTFKGAWNPIGTLAYVGFDYAWDCLIERVETFRMRHAPILNWVCSGNVIRDSTFHESDAQWHAGWCSDNLFEQCRIESTTRKHSGYGYGFFATAYNDSSHGPNGPRNVIYNCDSVSMKSSVYLGGGGNYNWLLMYNRFAADSGPGIIQRLGCRNNRIQGNVFILKNSHAPMLYYEFLNNTGDIVKDNIYCGGNGKLFQGPGRPEISEGNRHMPYKASFDRPTPPTPSIYQWQLNNYKNKR